MKAFRITSAIAAGTIALGLLTAGTASATMLTGPGSITADRSGGPLTSHKLQRDTSTRYNPRDSAVMINGSVDFGGIAGDGALFIGLVDADFYDNHPDDLSTYQSGAYAYFAPSGGSAGNFAPTDGNAGGGELLDNRGSLNGSTAGNFSLTINPDGTLALTFGGQTVDGTYGTVKGRPDVNGGTTTPYSADEFANGAYLAVELASSHGDNGPETVNYNLGVTGGGANNVPEPSELGLLGLGALLIVGGLAFRRRRSLFVG